MARIILPDSVEARLAQLGHMNDVTAWDLGDISEWVFQQFTVKIDGIEKLINPRTEEEIERQEVYSAIARAANKSPFSIRDYHYTSIRVPDTLRHEFDQLGRHHWKALAPHYTTIKEARVLCNKVLAWSDDYGGSLVSVAALRLRLAAGGNGELTAWAKRYKRARKLCKQLAEDTECPSHLRQAAEAFRRASVPLP